MPPIETMEMHQRAVLWEMSGYDTYGQPTVSSTPIEISVRWEWKHEEEKTTDKYEVLLDAIVVVDREIAEGSNMWLGTLSDWYGTGSAGDDSEVLQVKFYNEVPDLKDRYIRRTVGLSFFRDTPAT
jgi:hypothetical protein